MARSNEQTLGEVIKELLKVYRLETGIDNTKIINSWERVVGPMIANHTVDLKVKGKTLYVRLNSAALKNELNFAKSQLIRNVNKELKKEVITQIVIQ